MRRLLRWTALTVLGLAGIAVVVLVGAGLLARYPGEDTVPAGHKRNEALYVTMRDGGKIAADVWYPADLRRGEQVPTLVRSTR